MSSVKGCVRPVWYKNGRCPSAKSHFKRDTCCREVYSYLELLARRNNGFVFPTVADIARHAKKWKHSPAKCLHSRPIGLGNPRPGDNKIFYIHLDEEGGICHAVPKKHFSKRECERAIRELQRLGILSPRDVQTICGIPYRGWYLFPHEEWSKDVGGICELKYWECYQEFTDESVALNVASNVALNVASNVGQNRKVSH